MVTSLPSKGSHFSDGVRVGQYFGDFSSVGNGILLAQRAIYDIVPAVSNPTALAAADTYSTLGYATLAAGTSVTQVSDATSPYNGYFQLDCPRAILVTGTSGATAVAITIFGWDMYGQRMQESFLTPADTNTTLSRRAYKWVQAIYIGGNTTADISIGTADKFGLPFYAGSLNYVNAVYNAGATTAGVGTGGTTVVGDATAVSASTGDVRGTFAPTTPASGARLTITQFVSGASSDPLTFTAGVQNKATMYGLTPYFNALI